MVKENDITVAVVPREKFSYCPLTLDAILESASVLPFNLIYIDGNSPPSIRDEIRAKLEGRPNTKLMRYEHYFGPLQSRQVAIQNANTEYLVILDNDILVKPEWLKNLYECAVEEKAGAVVPLVLIGGPKSEVIHLAGGRTGVNTEPEGTSTFYHHQNLEHKTATEAADELQRQPTTLLEDHCIFARTEVWRTLGDLDPVVPLMASITELSLRFQATGKKLLFEPSSHVTYLWGEDAPLQSYDLPLWYLVWSEKWTWQQLDAIAKRHGVADSRTGNRNVRWWLGYHRRVPLMPLMAANRRFFARIKLKPVGHLVEKAIEFAEVGASYFITERVRRRPEGQATGCPALFSRSMKPRPSQEVTPSMIPQ